MFISFYNYLQLKLSEKFLNPPKPLQLSPIKTYPGSNENYLESHREKVILVKFSSSQIIELF